MTRRYRGVDGQWWTVEAVTATEERDLADRRMVAGWLSFRGDGGDAIFVAPVPPRWESCDTEVLEAFRAAGKVAGYSDRRHPPAKAM